MTMPSTLDTEYQSHVHNMLVIAVATLLEVEPDVVYANESSTFVKLGGDSVKALQLTFQLDNFEQNLDIATILDQKNSIRHLSSIIASTNPQNDANEQISEESRHDGLQQKNYQAFSYIPQANQEEIIQAAIEQIDCSRSEIEDILPVTGQQNLLWLGSLQRPGTHIAHWCFDIPKWVDLDRFEWAWLSVLADSPILRTRFILDSNSIIYQAIVVAKGSSLALDTHSNHSTFHFQVEYGSPLVGHVVQRTKDQAFFHLYAHHAVYDRWSMQLIFDDVKRKYDLTSKTTPRASFVPFLKPLTPGQKGELIDRWQEYFGQTLLVPVPMVTPIERSSNTSRSLEMTASISTNFATKAEMIIAAWSLVCSKQANASDISFGLTTWGRDVPIHDVSEMIFPTFQTIPVCLRLHEIVSISQLLGKVNTVLSTLRNLQRLGIDDISRINNISSTASRFNSIVVVQPESFGARTESALLTSQNLVFFELEQGHPLVLECLPYRNNINLRLNYDPKYLAPVFAESLLSHLCNALEVISAEQTKPWQEIDLFGEEDQKIVSKWSRPCEELRECKMYSMIDEYTRISPSSTALWTTKSITTYGQLIHGAETIAHILQSSCEGLHIGTCFEKSALAIIAQIGVLKAGCAFIPIDPENPVQRIEQIIQDSDMSLLLCSQSIASKFKRFSIPMLALDEGSLNQENLREAIPRKNKLKETRTAYIIYTSGSTGTPKGVVIEHEQISTSLNAQQKFFKLGKATRTLQFSSLAFDMSLHEIYLTLCAGGTLCIANDAERFDLEEFILRAKPNYAMLTPGVAATLSKDCMAQIANLSIGGDSMLDGLSQRVISAGSQPFNIYGPTETVIINLVNKIHTQSSPFNLGYSLGSTAWIVDLDDPHRLAPIGMPGELAFSGHTLARGYHKDAKKTEIAFRKDLRWTKMFSGLPLERVYLSGDLARFNADGSIQFLGRRGGYVKIAGNRVDLNEIEQAFVQNTDLDKVSVQLCNIKGHESSQEMLVCFFCCSSSNGMANQPCHLVEYTSKIRSIAIIALEKVRTLLPSYMIPSACIAISKIPLNTSGKLDKNTLQRLVENFSPEELLNTKTDMLTRTDASHENASEAEDQSQEYLILKNAWARLLSVSKSTLTDQSHFFKLGGTSLRAMELANKMRNLSLQLLVADIFKNPTFVDMAKKVRQRPTKSKHTNLFTEVEYDELVKAASKELCIAPESIEAIIPCTSLQKQLLVASEQSEGAFYHRDHFELEPETPLNEVLNICRTLVEEIEVLRTMAFFEAISGRFLQVIVRHDLDIIKKFVSHIFTNGTKAKSPPNLGLGGPLCHFSLFENSNEQQILLWEMHHSIYDGHSHALLLKRMRTLIERYRQKQPNAQDDPNLKPPPPYRNFIKYLATVDTRKALEFWSNYLKGSESLSLNILRRLKTPSPTNASISHDFDISWKTSAYTSATYIRAAFSLLLSRYSGSSDVNFASTINGRDLPIEHIENIVGPTFATLPARVKINNEETISRFLVRIQQDAADSTTHQVLPIEDIGRISPDCKRACQFRIHLLIQSHQKEPNYKELESLGYKLQDRESPMQLLIPFNLVATPRENRVRFEAIFNSDLIHFAEVELLLDQMNALLQQMMVITEDQTVSSMFCLGEKNIRMLETMQPDAQFDIPPASSIPHLVLRHASHWPDKEALYSSKQSLTYTELFRLSHNFARLIYGKLGRPKQRVGFCFEKSIWAIVAQLGILIAGHAFVPIDLSWPASRWRSVLKQTKSPLITTSPALASRLNELEVEILALDPASASDNLDEVSFKDYPQPSDIAYVLFTSGSTSAPKGVIIEHDSISRTLVAYAKRLRFTSSTRALLFASFAFDASIMETWSVLTAGGTLCIANDEERISDLTNFITKSRSDCVALTPTAAGLIDPRLLSDVQTLLLCGEKCHESDLKPWRSSNTTLVNAYGPTETSVNAATNVYLRDTDLNDIGTSLAGGLWIVNPDDVDERLPVGCTGELLISGPVLAREYLNDPGRTAQRFVYPTWLQNATNPPARRAFRTGDLAHLDSKGTLHLLGRIDTQMKINGIRVEAEEIEDAIHLSGSKLHQVVTSTISYSNINIEELVVYFTSGETTKDQETDQILPLRNEHVVIITSMHSSAKSLLPSALVPILYIPVSRIPFNVSGKVNRNKLAQMTSLLAPSQLQIYRADHSPTPEADKLHQTTSEPETTTPSTILPTELEPLQSLWTTVLSSNTNTTTLTPSSHFLETGGDSIAAIRLSALARSRGLPLSVSTIYAFPRLEDMARAVANSTQDPSQAPQSVTSPAAFELLDGVDIASPELASPASPSLARRKGRERGDYFSSR